MFVGLILVLCCFNLLYQALPRPSHAFEMSRYFPQLPASEWRESATLGQVCPISTGVPLSTTLITVIRSAYDPTSQWIFHGMALMLHVLGCDTTLCLLQPI